MSSNEASFQLLEDNFTLARRAIYNDDINILKHLLNSFPECCSFVDRHGNNFLHLSIALQKYEIFKYLLSLNWFHLESTNCDGKTALLICLTYHDNVIVESDETFAIDLINHGANINVIYCGNSPLHLSIRRHFFKTAQLLIEKGLDINVQNNDGCTPLHMIFHVKDDRESVNEGVGLMLYYGADPTICDNNGNLPFELAITYHPSIITTQEHLFYCTFDSFSEYRMSVEVLFELLETGSPLFYQIVEVVSEIVYVKGVAYSPTFFLRIKPEFLKVMIHKFDYVIIKVLKKSLIYCCDYLPGNLDNWEILLNSHLAPETIELVGKLKIELIINSCVENEIPKEATVGYIYYLLTYGLNVCDMDLEAVYNYEGYGELFKTLLFMDVKRSRCNIVPRIFCDIHFDLFAFLEDPHDFSSEALEVLLKYFAHPDLKSFCLKLGVSRLVPKVESLPKVPLLVELARDASRRFLITRYNIEGTSQMYSILKWLPISKTHERILSFETMLYD